jgi:hypothetical protein
MWATPEDPSAEALTTVDGAPTPPALAAISHEIAQGTVEKEVVLLGCHISILRILSAEAIRTPVVVLVATNHWSRMSPMEIGVVVDDVAWYLNTRATVAVAW